MSTFSKSAFKSLNYNSFRPHYPPSFYNILCNYVKQGGVQFPIETALDLGCGTGVASYPLLNFSQKVIGIDLSENMVDTANSLKSDRLKELNIEDSSRITFEAGAVEDLVYNEHTAVEAGSVDLITAAQCIHWFEDYDQFFASSAKLLKKGGVLAYYFYIDPVIVHFSGDSKVDKSTALKRAKEIYYEYAYDDPNKIGPHWEQPGRSIIKHFCEKTNEHIPGALFGDVVINRFECDFERKNTTASETDLDLKKENILIGDFVKYLQTYSGYFNYKEKTGDDGIFDRFVEQLENELGWDRNHTKIDLVWNTGYTFLRKT